MDSNLKPKTKLNKLARATRLISLSSLVFAASTISAHALSYDFDGDGFDDSSDNCPMVINPGQWDKDKDGVGNKCDDDIDGDGFSNVAEKAAGTKVWDPESFPRESSEDDRDGDGIVNEQDNCADIGNAGQWDKDNDGIGNKCDDDVDGDGCSNKMERKLGTRVWDSSSVAEICLTKFTHDGEVTPLPVIEVQTEVSSDPVQENTVQENIEQPQEETPKEVQAEIKALAGVVGNVIASSPLEEGAHAVASADFDNDGDLDVVLASAINGSVSWYESDGQTKPEFTTHVISTETESATDVKTADIDGDGDIDVVVAYGNSFAWFENDGAESPLFTQHLLSDQRPFAVSVFPVDMDGDGDIDILTAAIEDGKVAWYENRGFNDEGDIEHQGFVEKIVSESAEFANSVTAGDVDGDGDIDVLAALLVSNSVVLFENTGEENFNPHVIDDAVLSASGVALADMDGDGDMDILSSAYLGDTIAWYEVQDDDFSPTKHIISDVADQVSEVYAVDFDKDGDMDVLAALQSDNSIIWYENIDSDKPVFAAHAIEENKASTRGLNIADINGDSILDILSASYINDAVSWYDLSEK